jgi:diadenosine tetraphosphate (Ap4A) HIT family hydrolase
LFKPIGELSVSTLGLYDDGRFPGRCLLALNSHAEHFEDLPRTLAQQLTDDIQRAASAIRKATAAKRINLAILGNVEPHLHVHLIPRGGVSDPVPGRSPWSDLGKEKALAPQVARELIDAISRQLDMD